MNTTTTTPTYDELTDAIYHVMRAHVHDDRFSYFVDAFAAVMKARRVNRIDLYELLNAVTDYGRLDDLDALDMFDDRATASLALLNRTYANMDRAAAFATTDYPLVIDDTFILDYYNYTVLAHDTDPMRERKLHRQRPSVPSYREYIAR